jgi:hypothetical protein
MFKLDNWKSLEFNLDVRRITHFLVGACIRGRNLVVGPPLKTPFFGIFFIFRVLTPNLVSRALY